MLLPFLASRIRAAFARADTAVLLIWAVSLLGFALRVEHALTFDGPLKGSDYAAEIAGLRWMMENHRPFGFTYQLPEGIGYQPPLYYALGAVVLYVTGSERAVSFLAVGGWAIRQWLLWRILKQSAHGHRWTWLAVLTLNAVLPISALTDGKVNPEGFHSTLFTIAAYLLWRMERESLEPGGITTRTGAAFGAVGGLGVLTKATAALLPIAACVVFVWCAARAVRSRGWRAVGRRALRPFAIAALAWCLVASWWLGPNLAKYGHPFPHAWSQASDPILARPILERRPVAWMLPFSWSAHLRSPVIHSYAYPPPNLWAGLVTGTWSDFFNKGFCRLDGEVAFVERWGGWPVTERCIWLLRTLVVIGCFLTPAGLLSIGYVAWRHLRTGGREGSLALPALAVLNMLFVSLFALVYPLDDGAVLNARYLLPASVPMCACLGTTLAKLERGPPVAQVARALTIAAIGIVAALVVYERWGV